MKKNNLHTLENWKAIAASTNRESFITIFGREPQPGEVEKWVSEMRADEESNTERSYDERLVKVSKDQWRWERIF